MMKQAAREIYFSWLYDQAFPVRDENSPISYGFLTMVMHGIPFGEGVPNDSNRVSDAEELRDEFIAGYDDIDLTDYADMSSLGRVSVFEILVALSRRAQFMAPALDSMAWFRTFTANLGLLKYSDSRWVPRDVFRIQKILYVFNERRYGENGEGGIFPLKDPLSDQRGLELWFQMAAYVTENRMY